MGKVIRHADLEDDGMVSDIDTTDPLRQPVLQNQDTANEDEDEARDQVMPLQSKDDLLDHHHDGKAPRITLTMAEIKHIYHEEVEKQEDSDEATLTDKIIKIITYPMEFASMILIPNVDKEKINEWYCPLIPFTSMLGLLTITKSRCI